MKAPKITIILLFLLFCIFSCGNLFSTEEEIVSAEVNIYHHGGRFIVCSVFNTGDITITSFYISVYLYASEDILPIIRSIEEEDLKIIPNGSYTKVYDIYNDLDVSEKEPLYNWAVILESYQLNHK